MLYLDALAFPAFDFRRGHPLRKKHLFRSYHICMCQRGLSQSIKTTKRKWTLELVESIGKKGELNLHRWKCKAM